MSRVRIVTVQLCVLVTIVVGGLAQADETFYCDRFISNVPFQITAPGHYCLARNIITSIASGNAITINASSVWLDLNNFTLDGTPAGTATDASGIVAVGGSNITVRNGVVKGFFNGINLAGSGGNQTVENVWADRNYVNGIAARGSRGGHVLRHNVVTNTGGSTNAGQTSAANASVGIAVTGASTILDNQVTQTSINVVNGVAAIGFELDFEGDGQVAVGNRVIAAGTVGFACGDAATSKVFLRDNIVASTPQAYGPACNAIGTSNFP